MKVPCSFIVFWYFGYGSNMDVTALRAKGVTPRASQRASLEGYRLVFNVEHWFPHLEGGVANLAEAPGHQVHGVVHQCTSAELEKMDLLESRGDGYERLKLQVDAGGETREAFVYLGMPGYLDESARPTQRYLNILLRGARAAELPEPYVAQLARTALHPVPQYEVYRPPPSDRLFRQEDLSSAKRLTALCGRVFDMSGAPERLRCVFDLLGGRDMTLFFAHRHDSSDGSETAEDVREGRIVPALRTYLNGYLQNYAMVFEDVGRYD